MYEYHYKNLNIYKLLIHNLFNKLFYINYIIAKIIKIPVKNIPYIIV